MERVNLLLGGQPQATIKRGDTHTILDFNLVGKNNKPLSLTPSLINGVTFTIQDDKKEGLAVAVEGKVTSVNGEVTLALTDEFYTATSKFTSFLVEVAIRYNQGEDVPETVGIYPTSGYFSLEIMDTLTAGA